MTRLVPGLLLSTALATATAARPLDHGAADHDPADLYAESPSFARLFDPDRFGLMPQPSPIYDLRRLGAPGGPMQETGADPVGDSRTEAGITFLGQFVDHNVTQTSSRVSSAARSRPRRPMSARPISISTASTATGARRARGATTGRSRLWAHPSSAARGTTLPACPAPGRR